MDTTLHLAALASRYDESRGQSSLPSLTHGVLVFVLAFTSIVTIAVAFAGAL